MSPDIFIQLIQMIKIKLKKKYMTMMKNMYNLTMIMKSISNNLIQNNYRNNSKNKMKK